MKFYYGTKRRRQGSLPKNVLILTVLTGSTTAFVTPSRKNAQVSNSLPISSLYHPQFMVVRRDTEFIFGSDSVNLSDDDDDEDDEDEAQYQRDQQERQAVVQKYLDEDDKKFKEERRKKNWGEFADAKTKQDILRVEKSLKDKLSKENKRKEALAKLQGVQLEVLEPQDRAITEDNGNIQISAGSTVFNWYDKMDEELQQEWEDLESGNEKVADGQQEATDTLQVNGKVIPREKLQGVRVGSAGGWTLEVFPGDFVVHRKYGIGRFERTCLRPKSKLTKEEQEARDARRGEILVEACN